MTTAILRTPARALVQLGVQAGLTLAALTVTASTFSETAHAAPARGTYVAALATPVETVRAEILEGVMWRCAGDTCRGAESGGRPVSACARVARKFGPVARFTTPEGDLQPEHLARCNGK